MKRSKLISIIEGSAKNKVLASFLAVSLIGASGIMLSGANSSSSLSVNKTVLAGILNNDGNKACVINGNDHLILYTSSNTSSIAGYISVGEMLTINGYSNGYYNVTVQETGATGYISSSDMQKIVSGVGYDLNSLSGTAYIINVSTAVHLRENATMNSSSLAMLKNNTQVTLLGKQGEWYKVQVNGKTGYIYEEYVALTNSTSSSITNSSSPSSSINHSKVASTTGSTSSNTSNKTVSKVTSTSNKKTNNATGTTKSTSSSSTKATSSSNSNNTTGTTKSVTNTNGTTSSTGIPTYKVSKIAYIYAGENGTTGSVNIYKSPKGEIVETTLKGGTKVTVLHLTDGLSKIEYGNNQIGYVSSGYLSSVNPSLTGNSSNKTSKIAYVYEPVGDGQVGVYSIPASAQTAASDLQTTLESGTKITILGSEIKIKGNVNYYKIEYGNNQIGYIPAQYVSFSKPE